MKRALSLILSLSLVSMIGCQKKKERLSAPTVTLQISPSVARVTANGQKTFTATVRAPSGAVLNVEPTWTLSSDTLGQILPDTGAETIFYAGQGLGVSGTLQAAYNNLTATAQIAIGAETGNPATSYGFYSESLVSGMQLDVPNASDGGNGGKLGANGTSNGSMTLEKETNPALVTEGIESLKATSSGDATSSTFFYFSFGYPDAANISNDLSAFNNGSVKFDIKAPAGKIIKLKLEWETLQSAIVLISNYTVFDNQFHSVSIPMSAFTGRNLSLCEGVAFVVEPPDANGTFTFYIDNLRFER